jgi:hypothetical protein
MQSKAIAAAICFRNARIPKPFWTRFLDITFCAHRLMLQGSLWEIRGSVTSSRIILWYSQRLLSRIRKLGASPSNVMTSVSAKIVPYSIPVYQGTVGRITQASNCGPPSLGIIPYSQVPPEPDSQSIWPPDQEVARSDVMLLAKFCRKAVVWMQALSSGTW